MDSTDFKRKLTAVFSADVVGYSRLMGEDEAATVKTLETYRGVMFSLIKQHRGRVVDSPGDNMLAEFGSVVDAVQCAVSIQKELQTRNADIPENRRMDFRIGINLGDVIEEDERIYGDGVNIAARLEALADPGGICISKTAFDYIENKLPFGYRFIGDQTVKNITKTIGAYKVLMETRLIDETEKQKATLHFWKRRSVLSLGIVLVLVIISVLYWNFYTRGPSIEPASVERMAYPLPDKPSIAVLPFTNMSGDPEQDYIGDGLSENIISALSVSSQMFVMARNATFTYKGMAVKPQQVAEDLSVQYILEGSIQKSGNQLRVTAQFIDALSGHHLWSEVYDREMRNLFDLQDEITKRIMVSLQVVLSGNEKVRFDAKSTDNLEAWKHYIKGLELFETFKPEDNLNAREYFKTALEFDPMFVAALNMLAWTHFEDFSLEWSDSPLTSMNYASELAKKAVELNEQDPGSHALLGQIFLYQRQYEKAVTEGERAIALNPNYSLGQMCLAMTMFYSGRFVEAIALCKESLRLDPKNPSGFLFGYLAQSYIFLRRYEEALEAAKELEEHSSPGSRTAAVSKVHFSWIYQELGREEEARAYMEEALKIKPDFSLDNWATDPFKDPTYLQRLQDALRKAGMPEKPPGTVQEKPAIAVLPFDDISPEKDQEYFVLGLSEEILNVIDQIPGLIVKARTSSFFFKDQDKTNQEIAGLLDVDHILQGSVRKSGETIRITARLIKVADLSSLWSETYDRELKDVFKIQEDIANNVADKLKLTLEAFQLLGGTDDIEAYEQYLKAKGLTYQPQFDERYKQLELLDSAITLDPEFALAWAYKAYMHYLLNLSGPASRSIEEADACIRAAQKSIELEPNLGNGYVALGWIKMSKSEWFEAELNFRKALELLDESLSGDHQDIIPFYLAIGQFKRAHEILEKMRLNDPINQQFLMWYYITYSLLFDRHRAEEAYQHRDKLMPRDESIWHDEVITLIRLGSGDILSRDEIVSSFPIHNPGKENLDSPKDGLQELRRIYSSNDSLSSRELSRISIWAAYFGDQEFALDALEKATRISGGIIHWCWFPVFDETRQVPRFKEFVREIGLVDYWKEYGWPDLCRPVGDDDFVCD